MMKRYFSKTLLGLACLQIMADARFATAQDEPVIEETNPAVLQIIASDPATLVGKLRKVDQLLALDRPDLAKQYLQQIKEQPPNGQELVQAHRSLGTSFFLSLLNDDRISSDAIPLVRSVLKAGNESARNPRRISALTKQMIEDPSVRRRRAAFDELRRLPNLAVVSLVPYLRQATEEHRVRARAAMVGMSTDIEPALVGLLRECEDTDLQREAILVLGQIRSFQALPMIATIFHNSEQNSELREACIAVFERISGELPSRAESISLLTDTVASQLTASGAVVNSGAQDVTSWGWNDDTGELEARNMSARDAAAISAHGLARALVSIDPSRDSQLLYSLAELHAVKRTQSQGQALRFGAPQTHARAVSLSASDLLSILHRSLELNLSAGSIATCDLLAEAFGKTESEDGSSLWEPLTKAVTNPDRRVRMAAAEAIMAMSPNRDFPGSRQFVRQVRYAASSQGIRRALVAGPSRVEIDRLAGLVTSLGYTVDRAVTGGQVAGLAAANPDYEFVLLRSSLHSPPVNEVVQRLRQQPFAALLPVAVLSEETPFLKTDRIPLMSTYLIPATSDVMRRVVSELLATSPAFHVSAEARLEQARLALNWIERFTAKPREFPYVDPLEFESLAVTALRTPHLHDIASVILGNLATPHAQRALVDFAGNSLQPLEARQVALGSFRSAVDRRGVQLTTQQVRQQYDSYNRAAASVEETRDVMGEILNTIESTLPAQLE